MQSFVTGLKSRWNNYLARASDVYQKEGADAFVKKGASFSSLLVKKLLY
jgi:hypothetical protein